MNNEDRPNDFPEASTWEIAEKATGVVCLVIGFIILATATADTNAGIGVMVIVAGFTLLLWGRRR